MRLSVANQLAGSARSEDAGQGGAAWPSHCRTHTQPSSSMATTASWNASKSKVSSSVVTRVSFWYAWAAACRAAVNAGDPLSVCRWSTSPW